ncbi:MAG TPA: PASTA domain-containing protein [Gaiellaceae bacterium]|nr:PASTA domain-containing protein [Gaiellaceae bacterium]
MAVASGDRSVSVTGDIRSSVIVTGDNVTLNVSLDAAEGALLDRLADVRQPVPLPLPLDSRPRRFPNHVDREVVAEALLAEAATAGALNLYGEPGIGKSHVLAHAAHLPEADGPDGVVYVPAGEAPLDDVLQALFEEFFDCGIPAVRPSRSRLRRELAGRRALVVADGLELAPEEARALLEAAPECTFVVASTGRTLREGATIRLPGLELRYALELVEQELGRPLTAEERPEAERLCEALGGHPWRIREATARARDEGRTLAEAARALDATDMLEALTPGEKSVLAGLAAAGGGPVGVGHLRELAAVEDVEPVLADLERRHLVFSHSPRYSLAPPLLEEIEARWDLDPQRERALDHYAGWCERNRGEPEVAVEQPALVGLVRWAAATGRADEAVRLGRAADPALAASGRFGSWRENVGAVLEAARRGGDQAAEAWALHQRGTWTACLVGGEPALADLEAARELRERIGDRAGEAATRHNIEVIRGIAGGGGDGNGGRGDVGGGGHGPVFFAALAVLGAIVVALGLVGGLLAYDRLGEEPPITTTTAPDGTVLIAVPDVVGDDVEDALSVLEEAGLAGTVAEEFSDEEAGIVIRQDPGAGTEVEEGEVVALTVSLGPELVAVPDVVGLAEEDALAALADAGLEGSVGDRTASEGLAVGIVSAQDAEPGTELEPGSPVSVTVSTGPTPDLAIRIERADPDCSSGNCVTRVALVVSNLSEGLVLDPFDVTVDADGSEVTIPVEGLEPREILRLEVETPGNCYDPDCFVTAEVDSGGVVDETNEENNGAEFTAIG